ncbi:MAG: VanW family protein [Paenibacillaceae bacterium]
MGIRSKMFSRFGAAAILLLLACLLVFAYGSQHTVPRGVIVSGWTLKGFSLTQLDLQLKNAMTLVQQQQVLFTCKGMGCEPSSLSKTDPFRQSYWNSTRIALQDLGVQTNLIAITNSLHSMENGTWIKRAWTRWRISGTTYNLMLSFNDTKLQEVIKQKWSAADSFKPVNAYRKVADDDSIQIFPEINAYRLNVGELQKRLMAQMPDAALPWLLHLKEGKPLALNVILPIVVKKPTVTALSLKAQGITRNISQFTTTFATSAAGRIHNISASSQTMQDQLLAPGEIFDYSQIIRQTEKIFGYQKAPVIYNGKLVPGIGGGICQVSTTLYNAVLRAGLQIIERRNHSLPVSYVPLGQDATYATDYINFRFRNSTEHYLLIRTSIVNNTLTVKLFGTMQKEKTYEITSNIVKRLQPTTKYLYNSSLGKNEQQTLKSGKIGYVVETYRLQKLAGVLVQKELISKDTYPSQPTLVAVGERRRDKVKAEEPGLLEDGVSGPNFGG